ncbi:MAG: hypothetical protein JST70_02350 [Bacteroidetes bacterium]|nr:hypothetical protein [Bacteroidota bacterium]
MAYNIRNIRNVTLQKKGYFFDANLWLLFLKPPNELSQRQLSYLQFFEDFKSNQNCPKIIVTALLFSEIINRYLRDVTYPRFYRKEKHQQDPGKNYYKTVYRTSQQYKIDYALLCDDIRSYQEYCTLVNDELGSKITIDSLFAVPAKGLDFNDNYYCLLSKEHNYAIVTDDQDFFVEDIEILTLNGQLLEKAKNSIKIKIPITMPLVDGK